MKNILFVLIAFPCLAKAQSDFSTLKGKWEEEKRTQKKDKEIHFSDTLRLEIRADGFMMIRHTQGPTLTGQAEMKDQKLTLQDAKFTIIESSHEKLVLNDEKGTHHFKKIEEFTNSPVTKLIPGVEEGIKDIAFNTIKGKWTTYRKIDPDFNRTKFYIKHIDFREDKGNHTYGGAVSFASNDSIYTTTAIVHIKNNEMAISADKEILNARVVKSDGEELILQIGTIYYFMKQFGKK